MQAEQDGPDVSHGIGSAGGFSVGKALWSVWCFRSRIAIDGNWGETGWGRLLEGNTTRQGQVEGPRVVTFSLPLGGTHGICMKVLCEL